MIGSCRSPEPASTKVGDATAPGWTVEETMSVRKVDRVRISPDGQRVLYEVRAADLSGDKGSYVTSIYVANVDGTGDRELTRGQHSAAGAEWSPDGRWIAFVSQPPGSPTARPCGSCQPQAASRGSSTPAARG
jgi:Tol biopolymer transport system component